MRSKLLAIVIPVIGFLLAILGLAWAITCMHVTYKDLRFVLFLGFEKGFATLTLAIFHAFQHCL